MNADRKDKRDDETSRFPEESSSSNGATAASSSKEMKRSAVKELIQRYFYQLQKGCGNPQCSNTNCASSGKVGYMTPNEIAAMAIQLFSQDAKLCEVYNPVPKVPAMNATSNSFMASATASVADQDAEMPPANEGPSNSCANKRHLDISPMSTVASTSNACRSKGNTSTAMDADTKGGTATATSAAAHSSGGSTPTLVPVTHLTESIIDELVAETKKTSSFDTLLHAIDEVFSNIDKLYKSFHIQPQQQPQQQHQHHQQQEQQQPRIDTGSKMNGGGDGAGCSGISMQQLLSKTKNGLKKEDIRALEGETDKDEDSTAIMDDSPELMGDLDDVIPSSMPNQSATGVVAAAAAAFSAAVDDDDDGGDDDDDDDAVEEDDDDDDDEDVDLPSADSREQSRSSHTLVDLASLRRAKRKLLSLDNPIINEALNSNIIFLAESIKYRHEIDWENVIHCLVICFDFATNSSNCYTDLEYLERVLPKLCHSVATIPVRAQARLARIWAAHCKDQLQSLVECCQQLITLQVILDENDAQDNTDVIATTKVLKVAYYANILAGNLESRQSKGDDTVSVFQQEDDDLFFYTQVAKPHYPNFAENKLEKELSVSPMDCRRPLIPYEEFYNEALSDAIQMDRDYLSYKNISLDPKREELHFSFMLYSFILNPATKVIALYYDSRIRMYSERNSSLFNYSGENDEIGSPDLKLRVRRDNLINDALIGLELIAMSNPKDLKKQLVVEFEGEQGIDEGGVSKEFFQLIVEELFNPDFGMFTHQEDTNTVWFNSSPFENDAQFTLIGIILGLAIYNNIILAVQFPMVIYRKLMGAHGTFNDLRDWNPSLFKGLSDLLAYEDDDMEDVFMQTFKISYKNVFGEVLEHELKEGGGDILVGQHNKREFIDLYSDFLLNKDVERQFRAFKKGFDMVTDESPLKLLFRPEEIELLVCGSSKFDFTELEKSTEYEGGYTKDSPIVGYFWEIVHSLPEELKRKLLEFATGSDRVPVGGFSRLKLLITRHGPDTDRLPTSHTCFNVLLLPEYSTKEKLEDRLLKAISYSKGFGML